MGPAGEFRPENDALGMISTARERQHYLIMRWWRSLTESLAKQSEQIRLQYHLS